MVRRLALWLLYLLPACSKSIVWLNFITLKNDDGNNTNVVTAVLLSDIAEKKQSLLLKKM
jgi:hypothetical protein